MKTMNKNEQVFVRWLGAFGHKYNELQSLEFELKNKERQTACDVLHKGEKPGRLSTKVGLIVNPDFVVKIFTGDVYSRLDKNGALHKGARPIHTGYREAWVETRTNKCPYTAVIISEQLKVSVIERIKAFAEKNGLKTIMMSDFNKSLEKGK